MPSTERDKKTETIHLESLPSHTDTALASDDQKIDSEGLVKSRYGELSIPRTLWVFKRIILVTLAVYTGYVCEGFELNAGGSVIANAGFIAQFGAKGESGVRALNPTWVSTWSALLNVGQLLTFTYVSWFADRFGRKRSFYVAWLWLVVVCRLQHNEHSEQREVAYIQIGLHLPQYCQITIDMGIGQVCNGAGIGVLQIVCQVYIMEICPNRIRGMMVTFQQVWSGIGGIIVSVMMQQLNKRHPNNYLVAMRLLWIPIGLLIFFWMFIPESPWYHVRRGEKDKAMKSLRRLYGGVEGYDFEEEFAIIERTIERERTLNSGSETPGWRDVWRAGNLKRTLTVIVLSCSCQLCGLAIIFTYSTYFFSLAGLEDPFPGTLILNCVNLLAVLMWSMSTDKLGRRMIVNGCQTFVCCILFLVGGLYWTGAADGNKSAGTGLLVLCCFWSFTFQIIALSYYLFSAELPTALLRVKTGPFTYLGNSILGIATCYATPPMLLHMSIKAAFVYGAFSVPICVLMWLYVPETKGRSAAEIDELYERKIPAWRWTKFRTDAEEQMEVAVQVKGHVKQV